MQKHIPILLFTVLLCSCSQARPEDKGMPDAAQLPTLPVGAATSTSSPEAGNTAPVFGTTPTQVPPTFFYTPPPTIPTSTLQATSASPMGTPHPEAYEVFALEMVDETHGWAIFTLGRISESNFWLGRTTDSARSWQNVTPPAFAALQTGAIAYFADNVTLEVYALDSETAWAYTSCFTISGQCHVPAAIWRTVDGGRSWRTLPVPTDCISEDLDCIPYSLQFLAREHGWLLMALVGRNYIQFDFYRTNDGGETWQEMPRLAGSRNVQVMKRPIFFNETFGVKRPASYINDPKAKLLSGQLISLDITYDGGYTWRQREIPPPEGFREALEAQSPGDDPKLALEFSIVMTPGETSPLSLGVGFRLAEPNAPDFFHATYFSRDLGISWQALSKVGDAFYFDQETGWRLADGGGMLLEETSDGGATWKPFPGISWELEYELGTRKVIKLTDGGTTQTEIPTRFLVDRLWPGQGLRLESLHMQTALEGWAVEIAGATLCTEDGARTWQLCSLPEELAIPGEAELPDTEGAYFPDEPLPEEMFHGGPVPATLQGWIDHGRRFLPDISADDVYFNPFAYFCKTRDADPMGGDRVGISRQCSIRYPTEEGRLYFYLVGYWMYYYSVTIQDGEQQVWPNVVAIDFVDENVGWRLLDNVTGLFRLEKTEDGGETWRLVKTVAWLGQLEFVSMEDGWAIALEPPERGVSTDRWIEDPFRPASLLHTTDGGRTWQEILPVIGE